MKRIFRANKFARLHWLLALAAAATLATVLALWPQSGAGASGLTALQLADRALMSPALLEDEGQYRLIDPVGPGGASSVAAAVEVYASSMIAGRYGPYRSYRDPFTQPIGAPPVYPGAPYRWPIQPMLFLELAP